MFDLQGFGHLLLSGAWVTLQLAFSSLFFGLILGLIGAALSLTPFAPVRWTAIGLNTVLRGIPELLLVLLIYFGATYVAAWASDEYVEISAFAAGVMALSTAFGAYATEVFRSAILHIAKGQHEAAFALGMTRSSTFFHITLPQVWRTALPGLGNLFLVLLKDTALVSVVGLNDVMRQAAISAAYTKLPFTFYFCAAAIYLLFTIISMQVIHLLERWANRGYSQQRS